MIKIFIDTTIYLGLYETNHNSVTIFDEDISKLKSYLIITEQVYDEFIRNRDRQLEILIENSKKYNNLKYPTSSLIRSLKEWSDLDKIKNEFHEGNKRLVNKLQEIKEDTDKDIIFKSFLKLYYDSEINKYKRNTEIIKNAYNRKLLGNPPGRDKKNTIGDEVNWEIILLNLKDDLVIITHDTTYKDNITFLKKEFKSKTNKELFIDENISFALKKIGEISSDELIKLEEEQSKEKLLYNSISAFSNSSLLSSLASIPSSSLLSSLASIPSSSLLSSLASIPSSSLLSSLASIPSSSLLSSLASIPSSSLLSSLASIPSSSLLSSLASIPSSSVLTTRNIDICPQCNNYGRREDNRCSSCGYTYYYE